MALLICSTVRDFDRRGRKYFEMDIDIEHFIYEIESREAIWNTNCDEYSDRILKMTQWNELIDIYTDHNATLKERRRLGLILRKRWRTLRDAFVKQHRILARSKSGSTSSKKLYKYYNQLLFLLPIVGKNNYQIRIPSSEDTDTVDRPRRRNIIPPRIRRIRTSDSTEKIGRELVNVLKAAFKQKSEDEDPDRQFMLSLVNDFKNVPPRLKASVKMNIIECIMEAQVDE